MRSAALTYFSISRGEMVRTSPMLSKPWPESSVGKSRCAAKSTPNRSRMVFAYSARLRRLAVTRPGSGLTFRSARSNSPRTYLISPSTCAAEGCGVPLGGISPLRIRCRMRSQPSRFCAREAGVANAERLRLPEASRSLWHAAQFLLSNGSTTLSKAEAETGVCGGAPTTKEPSTIKSPNSLSIVTIRLSNLML